eukprot:4892484-Amphidinium_carterae.1
MGLDSGDAQHLFTLLVEVWAVCAQVMLSVGLPLHGDVHFAFQLRSSDKHILSLLVANGDACSGCKTTGPLEPQELHADFVQSGTDRSAAIHFEPRGHSRASVPPVHSDCCKKPLGTWVAEMLVA